MLIICKNLLIIIYVPINIVWGWKIYDFYKFLFKYTFITHLYYSKSQYFSMCSLLRDVIITYFFAPFQHIYLFQNNSLYLIIIFCFDIPEIIDFVLNINFGRIDYWIHIDYEILDIIAFEHPFLLLIHFLGEVSLSIPEISLIIFIFYYVSVNFVIESSHLMRAIC